jgi:hypothetical protein
VITPGQVICGGLSETRHFDYDNFRFSFLTITKSAMFLLVILETAYVV